MKAAIIRSYGAPSALELTDVDDPKPMPTEVRVRVRAVGTNPVDAAVRSGRFPLLEPPAVLGWDVSGVVETVGGGVTRFAVGDEVFGMPRFPRAANAYAELVTAPSRQLAKKPAKLSHAEAAALPLAGLTAYQALVDAARVVPGQRVLVHGAGGGVGHLAVQIAKALGAEVFATASAGKIEFVKKLGASAVVDYRSAVFEETLRELDVVFDTVGRGYGDRSLPVLKEGGALVTIVDHFDTALAARVRAAGRRFLGIAVEPDSAGLEALARLVDAGQLRPHVSHAVPFERVREAHELLEGSVTGKIVLTLDAA
jgi:NADPH:quinone reductase-like Zn-dependent oxidoreductase